MTTPSFHDSWDSKAPSEMHVKVDVPTATQWCNTYRRPSASLHGYSLPPIERYGPDPYDINFCFPYLPEGLTSSFVKLVPFVPRLHAQPFFDCIIRYSADIQRMRMPHPRTVDELASWLELEYRRKPGNIVFAAMFADGTSGTGGNKGTFGAVMSLEDCDSENLSAEIGMTINLRRHDSRRGNMPMPVSDVVLSASLLLRYCFNLPTNSPPRLGLRRVGMHSLPDNLAVQRLVSRFGFRLEGIQRWCRMADPAKGKKENGNAIRKGDILGLPGIDAYYLTICWDEWEGHGRERVRRHLKIGCEARL